MGNAPLNAADLRALGFRAETNPLGPRIDLVWQIPVAESWPGPAVHIVRRERRFPGKGRRGRMSVPAAARDLQDGTVVFDTADAAKFDFQETREEWAGDLRVSTTRYFLHRGARRDRVLLYSVRHEFTGEARSRTIVRFTDHGTAAPLLPGTIYYYTAFVGDGGYFSRDTQASALATAPLPPTLFAGLPQIHQRLDAIPPAAEDVSLTDVDKGQLQRFVEVFEAHADMLRGLVEGLRDLHNLRRTDSRFILSLAQLVGWKLREFLDEDEQRAELGFTPEIYQALGTSRNLAAMVNRLTGWDTKVKEFVRNVAMSFDTSRLEMLQSSDLVYLDGSLPITQKGAESVYLDGSIPPVTRRRPPGTVDTTDSTSMYRLRIKAFDDLAVYTYDCGKPDGQGGYLQDDSVFYNRETIAVYIVPHDSDQFFAVDQAFHQVRQTLADVVPIHARMVFVVDPGALAETYDTLREMVESGSDRGIAIEGEIYGEGADALSDLIPQWRWLISNRVGDSSVDTALQLVNINVRTWHTGLAQKS